MSVCVSLPSRIIVDYAQMVTVFLVVDVKSKRPSNCMIGLKVRILEKVPVGKSTQWGMVLFP